MRGDSLRDLYAKSLAIVGLGVLAGIGALVDYWPTRAELPRVLGAPAAPQLARALPIRTVDVPAPTPLRTPVSRRPAPAIVAAAVPEPMPVPPVSALTVSSNVPMPQMAGVDLAPAPLRTIPALAVTTELPASTVELSAPSVFADAPVYAMALQADAESGDDGGFFSSATGLARKAGSSILSTGSKAGASIIEGLSFVGRGLKKLKFF